MICKLCGHNTERLIFEAVMPPAPKDWNAPIVENFVAYRKWACEKCGRYHFPDGSLYSNPFKEAATPSHPEGREGA